jgi:FecR protein.
MKIVSKILAGSVGCVALVFPYPNATAASSKEARVTQIVREVKLLPADAAAREAALNEKVSENTSVRTGGESRSELTFPDLTITRLGANTVFSFNKSGRTANVDSGSILLRVPKDSGGGTIRSSAVTVAITGTTVISRAVVEGEANFTIWKALRGSR